MLQRLFIFLLIFLILPDIYLYLRFIVHLTAKRWLRILYWLPAFLLSSGLLYLVYFSNNAGLTVTNVATKLSRIKDKLKKMKKE